MPPPHLFTQDDVYQRGVDAGLTVKIVSIFGCLGLGFYCVKFCKKANIMEIHSLHCECRWSMARRPRCGGVNRQASLLYIVRRRYHEPALGMFEGGPKTVKQK
ncbi:MAG: hypothetical protein ACJAYH_000828 [Celeribacter sp.]|jgi:hypothetical protein